jgi:hypothetical protein
MVIFHSYVSLPEGIYISIYSMKSQVFLCGKPLDAFATPVWAKDFADAERAARAQRDFSWALRREMAQR